MFQNRERTITITKLRNSLDILFELANAVGISNVKNQIEADFNITYFSGNTDFIESSSESLTTTTESSESDNTTCSNLKQI